MSHVPWLGSIALSLPVFAQDLKVFRAHAQNWARRRVKEGSTRKDLFYHLVRCNLNQVYRSKISDFTHTNFFFFSD